MTREDEQYCLQELAKGNRHAFEWLFLEWHPKLVDFFCRLLGDEETAYDLAQDVFFDVWTSRSKFAQVNSFSSYLFQMARFKAFNHFDRSAVKARFRSESLVTAPDSEPSGESALYAAETSALMREALNQMPEKRRTVFIMSRLQGYSNDEIAAKLGISKRTVENHITTVLADLKKVMNLLVLLCVLGLEHYY